MTYSKPEVMILGNAVRVIESFQKPYQNLLDTNHVGIGPAPAYDLDE